MAGYIVPRSQDEMLALAGTMADGCHNLEVAIGLQHNKEADMRAAIAGLRTAEAGYGRAKANRQTTMDALQVADAGATKFLANARMVLSSFLGNAWGTAWVPTGFPNRSTGVPRTRGERLNLCAALKIYFTNNPPHEVAALGVTAVNAGTQFQALRDAQDGLAMQTELQSTAKQARDAAYLRLRKRMQNLIAELDTVLTKADPHWVAFGLRIPAAVGLPDSVAALTLTPGGAGNIIANWPRAARATRYRPFVQGRGKDAKFVARDPVHDPTATLTGFKSGQTVKVYIVAANKTGEAQPSPTEQIVVP